MIVALAGGVGGAKLAVGLSLVQPFDELFIAVNTGDDFAHLGLHISPDLDTVMYTLAGKENAATGWGLSNETWSFMAMLQSLGGETWFKLGDSDLAVHIERSRRLSQGIPLSVITSDFCKKLNISHHILPMTDDEVRTILVANGRQMAFQDYFVKYKCEPAVSDVAYQGADVARPLPALLAALTATTLRGIVICPSNPHLSIAPMLAMPSLTSILRNRSQPALAVSPIIGGKAVKGPAAKILHEMGLESSCVTVAKYYSGLIDYFLIDRVDIHHASTIRALSIEPIVTDILMRDVEDRRRLARECCELLRSKRTNSG